MARKLNPTPSSGPGGPLVSIVIPCYNAAPMIERCMRSCMAQSYRCVEVILVNNNCTDHSIEMARTAVSGSSIPFRVTHCPQQGPNHARRAGFANATGKYIQWLDADDELKPDKIARQVAALQIRTDLDIAYGDWIWRFIKDGRAVYETLFRSEQYDDYLMQLLIDNWRPTLSFLLRRPAADRLAELDAWDLRTPCMTDREYYSIAAAVGMRFGYVPDAVSVYNRWSNDQITGRMTGAQRAETARRMFDRLGNLVQTHGSDRLHDHHRQLLRQNWKPCKAVPTCVELRNGSPVAVLEHPPGKSIRLNRPLARVLQTIAASDHPAVAETHARTICRHLWRHVVAKWNVSDGPPDVARVTRIMAELIGVNPRKATAAEIPAIPDQTIENDVVGVSRLLNSGMIFLPIFASIRFQIRILIEELDELGLLERST